jgi:competence protein ComGB
MRDGYVTRMSKKWTLVDQGNFLKKTGELLDRGYSYSEAVESILVQMPNSRHAEIKEGISELKAGQPLYKVLSKLKFQKEIIGYIYFADKHGSMSEAISEGSRLLLKKNSDLRRFRKVFSYPVFMFVATIILFAFVDRSLIPQYFSLYESMSLELNFFTKAISSFGKMLPLLFFSSLVVAMLVLIFYLFYFRSLPLLLQRKILLHIPLFGSILRLIQSQYFTRQLGYLLAGGLSVHESLLLFQSIPKNFFYRDIATRITERLKTGESLAAILQEMDYFEKELPYVINHGQTNGKLDQELLFFSQNCLNKLEGRMEKSLKLVQPIIYGIVALLVISMYLSIMLPMFQLLNGM